MLPADRRMKAGTDFRSTIRSGGRSASGAVVAHVLPGTDAPATVGLVVSKKVGNAVVRNRVKRRLRHQAAARVEAWPEARVVLRALPEAASRTGAELGDDLDRAVRRAAERAGAR